MATKNQLSKKNLRKKKIFRSKSPHMKKKPQVSGICSKIFIKTPKKPNSAERKVAKVKFFIYKKSQKRFECYIPGEGHTLQQYSKVLVRGGRVPDLPGVKYHIIRGKYDLGAVKNRKTSRSKYGMKKDLKVC